MEKRPDESGYPRSTVELIGRRADAEGLVELVFDGWRIAREARPGQFVNLRVSGAGTDPLLRRPMSVAFVHEDRFGVLVQNVGVGSRMLTEAPLGARFDTLGPLGRGFPEPPKGARVALVGGGVGVAPLRFLYDSLPGRREWEILVGARSERLLPFRAYLEGTRRSRFATDDGTAGARGTVVDLLVARQREAPFARVYSCGPPAMMLAVGRFALAEGVECILSLEAHMACAMGQCLGCVVALEAGGYARVCTEGPCFDAREVVLAAGGLGVDG